MPKFTRHEESQLDWTGFEPSVSPATPVDGPRGSAAEHHSQFVQDFLFHQGGVSPQNGGSLEGNTVDNGRCILVKTTLCLEHNWLEVYTGLVALSEGVQVGAFEVGICRRSSPSSPGSGTPMPFTQCVDDSDIQSNGPGAMLPVPSRS